MPIRSRKLNIIACVSAMQLTPATPNQTERRRWDISSISPRAVAVGNAMSAASVATTMMTARVRNSAGPPNAAMRLGVATRKAMANAPSAMPTMPKSRCGLALWAIVPWVKLSAQPADAPAMKCSDAIAMNSVAKDAAAKASAAAAKSKIAAKRESIRLKRGAKERLLRTAPIKKSVASPPACGGLK